jgi:hypothetical protein
MKLIFESDRAIIQFEEDDSRILTYGNDGRCSELDITLDAFEDLCLQYTAFMKAILKDIKND